MFSYTVLPPNHIMLCVWERNRDKDGDRGDRDTAKDRDRRITISNLIWASTIGQRKNIRAKYYFMSAMFSLMWVSGKHRKQVKVKLNSIIWEEIILA